MNTAVPETLFQSASGSSDAAATPVRKSRRIAAIDWMRGFVMLLMIIDHASMAFDRNHIPEDSAMYANAARMARPAGEFFTRVCLYPIET